MEPQTYCSGWDVSRLCSGGGLSVAVAASGNSPDYYPYLEEIGAAGINAKGDSTLTDDWFAMIAYYCPITVLDHTDIAYEWQYAKTRPHEDYTVVPFSDLIKAVSASNAPLYPPYLESLGLKLDNGTTLTVESLPSAIEARVKAGIIKAMTAGETIPELGQNWSFTQKDGSEIVVCNNWLDVDNLAGTVISIGCDKYLEFVCIIAKLKPASAFDNFGTPLQYLAHYAYLFTPSNNFELI